MNIFGFSNIGHNKDSYWSRSCELSRTSSAIFNSFGQVLTHIDKMLIKLISDLSFVGVGSVVTFNFRDGDLSLWIALIYSIAYDKTWTGLDWIGKTWTGLILNMD